MERKMITFSSILFVLCINTICFTSSIIQTHTNDYCKLIFILYSIWKGLYRSDSGHIRNFDYPISITKWDYGHRLAYLKIITSLNYDVILYEVKTKKECRYWLPQKHEKKKFPTSEPDYPWNRSEIY